MQLSLKYNFLFVHIAKTGGTSVRAALARYKWREAARVPMFIASRLSSLNGHRLGIKLPRHARAIAAQEMLPPDVFARLFKFTFVRNPWDLQVSSYHHVQRERPDLLSGIPDFSAFIRYKLDPNRPPQYHLDTSSRVQCSYLVDLDGHRIVDFVGRYEHLSADFAEACQHIGIEPIVLGQRRRAPDRLGEYRRYYDTATAERVADFFARDIEAFGYQFDPPDTIVE
ncbi:sulfotransferase family 2 domain-containing protein [Salinisphaera sp. USBA-960]|uniref:sulfotransferase family 2 domain-containing protein n=1 Tax=Salinisphaera orenii TaxID=856731 RepID=UPI000DBE5C83|nr:sulfotransferase family 2 domain-containing protein [Salifodinibacter halophilus]NNC27252.1 sulfotransferase family 2 domain-containing protein [Salifodinibacter halophilus]